MEYYVNSSEYIYIYIERLDPRSETSKSLACSIRRGKRAKLAFVDRRCAQLRCVRKERKRRRGKKKK